MSLKSIFHDIGQWVANMFKHIEPVAKKAVAIGVQVTSAIKDFETTNPEVVDTITKLIPGTADDKAVSAIRETLPKAMIELKLVDATLGLTDPDAIVKKGIEVIQQMSGDFKSATLNSLSIILTRVAADGKLGWDDAVYLGKWFYDHEHNPEVDTTVEDAPIANVQPEVDAPAQ